MICAPASPLKIQEQFKEEKLKKNKYTKSLKQISATNMTSEKFLVTSESDSSDSDNWNDFFPAAAEKAAKNCGFIDVPTEEDAGYVKIIARQTT